MLSPSMSPGAIVEADIAKTETTNDLHFTIELVVVGELSSPVGKVSLGLKVLMETAMMLKCPFI